MTSTLRPRFWSLHDTYTEQVWHGGTKIWVVRLRSLTWMSLAMLVKNVGSTFSQWTVWQTGLQTLTSIIKKKNHICFENTQRRSPTIHIIMVSNISQLLLASSSLCSPIYLSSSIRPKTPLKHFLTSWPWPLTYDLDLWTWPRYPSTWPTHKKSGPYVCPFSRESGNTHRHTDNVKTITPVADAGCKEDRNEHLLI